MIAVSCDPGLSGGLACYCSERGLLAWCDLPVCHNGAGPKAKIHNQVDARALRLQLRTWSTRFDFAAAECVIGVIERMASFGDKDEIPAGVLLSMGHSAGVVEGVLAAYTRSFLRPLPQQWKKQFALKRRPGETTALFKARSVREVQLRFPQVGRVRDDVAEAILLAFWACGQVEAPAVDLGSDPMAMPA